MNNLKAKVICAGNCPVCNKPLKDGECIFMCNECKIKNEIFMELEKIKAEIRTIPQVHIKTGAMSLDKELVVPLNKVIEKLDNHISELKGE